jgi:hypothetical protein
MATVNEKMTAIADAIRDKTGGTDALTLDDMVTSIPKVYNAGEQAEYDRFWDNFQNYGKRTNYWGAFTYWSNAIFNPKYPLDRIAENNYMFMGANVPVIPRLVFVGGGLTQPFYNNSIVHTIECVVLKENGSQKFTTPFQNCTNLKNIIIEGKIGQNGFDVRWSTKLTHDSLMSIINALYDYSTDTSGTTYTLTLGTENLAKLTDSEKAIATQRGWSLA